MFFNNSLSSIKKWIRLVAPLFSCTVISVIPFPPLLIFYICARSQKNCTKYANSIFISITDKVLIDFLLEEIFWDMNALSTFTSFKRIGFYSNKIYNISIKFINFNITKPHNFLTNFISDNNFLCFIMSHYCTQISIFNHVMASSLLIYQK